MQSTTVRPLMGTTAVVVVVAVVAFCVAMFRGDLTKTVPITVLADRAGLVMNPDAKVKMWGVQVGTVDSIDELPNGQAALHLAMDPAKLKEIPANVGIDIASTTVFGSKFVRLVPPADPSPLSVKEGQTFDASHVTVEINTLFRQLVSVLSKIEPAKLNETLGALSSALNGRGAKFGQTLTDFDALLAKLEVSLPAMNHDLQIAPAVINAYADAAPDLAKVLNNTTQFSQTVVDQQQNLDTLLVSVIGLADVGNQVLGDNRQPLTDVLHLLVPTTDLTHQYAPALTCGLAGTAYLASGPQLAEPGVVNSVGFTFGVERYRYPKNLPKVAATGDSQCAALPKVAPETTAPFVVADTGANPWQYGNQGILLNSDALKQFLYGPIDGPPRNTSQTGQPG